MAHNHSCAHAKNPGCACAGCAGSLHGWPGYFDRAEAPEPERERFRRHTDLEWLSALGTGKRQQNHLKAPTLRMRKAANDSAVADALTWLAHDPDRITRGRKLGQGLHEEALPELRDHAGRHSAQLPDLKELDRVLPGHFWCSLLVQLSGAGDTVQRYSDRVPQVAAELLLDGETPPGWGEVQDHVAEVALTAVWKCAGYVLLGDFANLVRLMRFMSLFICPDPARHPLIVRRGFLPLGEGVLAESTLTRLQQAYLTDSAP
jgi:hypothetical protein